MKFWKKAGWFCMTILPVIASFTVQILTALIFMLVLVVMSLPMYNMLGFQEYINYIAELVYSRVSEMTFALHLISIPIFGVWYYFGCGRPKAGNVKKILTGRCVLTAVIIAVGLLLFANSFVFLSEYIFPESYAYFIYLMETSGIGVTFFGIIASVILAPVGEEIVCRGIVFHYAKKLTEGLPGKSLSFWVANVIQALLFGVLHGNFIQGAYAFVYGLGLGWIRERYKSLYPAILVHFLANFLTTFVMGYVLSPLPETIPAYMALGIISFAVMAAAVYISREKQEAV